MSVQILIGDCLVRMKELADDSIDSVVCDPPYHLTSIVKRFGSADSAPCKVGATGAYARASKGFMGQTWDGGDVAFRVETWAEVLRVLKPGGHLVAFSGTRTYHRMAVAIEDAGFEVRDMIAWHYGSGFPKSHDISKAIDKVAPRLGQFDAFAAHFAERRKASGKSQKEIALLFPSKTGGQTGCVWNWENGANVPTPSQWAILQPLIGLSDEWGDLIARVQAEREVVGSKKYNRSEDGSWASHIDGGMFKAGEAEHAITLAATDEARKWSGYGTALKPATEPVLYGAKPVTPEQHFAIVLHELTVLIAECFEWSNSSASDAEKSFTASLAKQSAVASSVLDSAKIQSLASIGTAWSAARSFTLQPLESDALTRTRDASALSHVRQSGSPERTRDQTTPAGEADALQTELLAMSMSVTAGNMLESIGLSWPRISDAILNQTSKFTIETASRLTTALKILNCSLRQNISTGTGGSSLNTEPICLARKPLSEKSIAANCLRWGTGALNIDATRVHADDAQGGEYEVKRLKPGATLNKTGGNWRPEDPDAVRFKGEMKPGRWPANLCHDGSDEVVAGFPDTQTHGGGVGTRYAWAEDTRGLPIPKGDSGSAARFFYTAKASSDERGEGNGHPTVKPVSLMRWLVRLVTPKGGTVLDPFAGSGSTLIAADAEQFNAIGIELSPEYAAIAERRVRDAAGMFADVKVAA